MTKAIQEHYWMILATSVLLCTFVVIGTFRARTQPHMDEVFSYNLSNQYGFPLLHQDYFHHWHDGEYYRDALTVQPEERFDYRRVCYNLSLDVHPPLYYFSLHTICSLFPNQFSWWFAFSINIVFYIGSIILIFMIGNALGMAKSRSLLAAVFWGLSSAGINEVCFLRMYMMLTFIMLCVTYR